MPISRRHQPNYTFLINHGMPLLGYTALTLLMTWPLLPHFLSHIPGNGDAPWFLWQFWWFKYSLLDLHQLPYTTDLIFYPLRDVPVMAQTPVNETLMLPLLVGTNLPVFYNTLFLLTYILSGYFTYLLGRALHCRPLIAFVGGVIFAFCAYRGMRGLGHLSLLTTQWMPLSLLLALQCWRRPSPARGVALGVATALVALSSPYYIGLFLLPVMVVGGFVILLGRRRACARVPLWQVIFTAGETAALLTIPLYLHYLFLEDDIYTMTSELGRQAAANSADLLAWVLPSGMNAWWGAYTASIYAHFSTPNLMETTLFVGFVPLGLFLASWFLRRVPLQLRFWQFLTLLTMVLALGPTLHINGQPLWDGLPYRWLLTLPGFDGFRIPSRAGITTALALSVLAMFVTQRFRERYTNRWHWRWGLGLFTVLYLLNVFPFYPHPLTDVRVPAIYEALAEMPDDKAILELPAGEYFGNGFNYFANVSLWMSYQSAHHHPTVSGYLGRRPARLHEPEHTLPFVQRFFNDAPGEIAVDLPDLSALPEPAWPDDIQRAETLLADEGIGAVALHCRAQNEQDFCYAANLLLTQALGQPTAVDGSHRLYQVTTPRYSQTELPARFVTAAVQFGATSRAVTNTPGRRSHPVHPQERIKLTIPIPGQWALQGVLTGAKLEELQILVDDTPVAMTIDAFAPNTASWQLEERMAMGEHTLTIQLPSQPDNTPSTPHSCTPSCLHNLNVRLVEPVFVQSITPTQADKPEEEQRVTPTFVNEQNEQATLLGAVRYRIATAPATATWLLTIWQLNDDLRTVLATAPEVRPTLFVHIQDAKGQVVGQADHHLGEHNLLLAESGLLYDFIALPSAVGQTDQVTIGLWYPDKAAYFWNPATPPGRDPASWTMEVLPTIDLVDNQPPR